MIKVYRYSYFKAFKIAVLCTDESHTYKCSMQLGRHLTPCCDVISSILDRELFYRGGGKLISIALKYFEMVLQIMTNKAYNIATLGTDDLHHCKYN